MLFAGSASSKPQADHRRLLDTPPDCCEKEEVAQGPGCIAGKVARVYHRQQNVVLPHLHHPMSLMSPVILSKRMTAELHRLSGPC